MTLTPGLQVKDPSKRPNSATSRDVFRDSAAGRAVCHMGKTVSVFDASRGGQRLEKDDEAMQGSFDWKGTQDP